MSDHENWMSHLSGLALLPASALALDVGDQAPDFVMHSTVGETVGLSEYQGRKTALRNGEPAE